ncbi:hypothetical protein ERO13_D06G072800v2 [Gossypium hirsutum]|uniref:Uncharacterized protein isoform X1 n=1 Tax=Gossypium hirsutum TaxID=3635 RepID=A0ABM3A8U1_GOSHI|nr:uncharacterized protein LOC107935272 isoform X1 [Gossypium hirsutum]KAG4141381.1 hypothetical protein ERO13_D06G072800v2 [Gossypium hirsutum]
MASLLSLSAAISVRHKLNRSSAVSANTPSKICHTFPGNGRCQRLSFKTKAAGSIEGHVLDKESASISDKIDYGVVGIHHVGILCENLERSLDFYQNILGLEINEARPHDKLPYRGAWLWVGSEMIHLMELPNPDPLIGRPEHGGRDRHACISIQDVSKLQAILDKAGIPYTLSRSGRPAIFTRDPDANALEFTQV